MSQKTHSQDSNFNKEEEVKKSIQAYKEAAKADAFMFGDYAVSYTHLTLPTIYSV